MDKLFLAACGISCRISQRRTCFDCLCCCELIALCFARPFGKRRCTVREHFGVPDAWFAVDDGLLARGPIDPGRSLFFQHECRDQSINGFTGFYFSFITLSTVGYGDIIPVSRIARWLAAMEAMTGLLYVAVLIARLVAMYSSPKSKDSEGPTPS